MNLFELLYYCIEIYLVLNTIVVMPCLEELKARYERMTEMLEDEMYMR